MGIGFFSFDAFGWIIPFLLVLYVMTGSISKLTDGFLPNYAKGTSEGFLVQHSKTGVLFKTNEFQLQLGTGNSASLQEPFDFSAKNEEVVEKLLSLRGKKIRISYKKWFFQPWRFGATNYEALKVEELPTHDQP